MLAINFAYVTSIGKLVGVVSLKELRQAIEDANSGNPPKRMVRPESQIGRIPNLPSPDSPKTDTLDPRNIV